MSDQQFMLRTRDFIVIIVFLQFVINIIIFFDVPIIRQILVFTFLMFVPGFVIINLLKLYDFGNLETILFSIGFSIAFLMFAGLIINELGFIFHIFQPLSLMSLMLIFNSLFLIFLFLIYQKNENIILWNGKPPKISKFALLFTLLPILSIWGAIWVNVYVKNIILLFMILIISLLFVISVISKKLLPTNLYPFIIFLIAITLLYHASLISNYIVTFGSDVPVEYYLFITTKENMSWGLQSVIWGRVYGRVYDMLSVTILPTIFASFCNIDPTWIFKLLFPLIFSLTPIVLYRNWKTSVGEKFAFVSVFLVMAQQPFYTEMLGLNRQMVAELFFALLLLLLSDRRMKPFSREICFLICSCSLVVSHYGLAIIFFFFISFILISSVILRRPSQKVTASMVVFFFIIMFTWYIFTSKSAVFESILQFSEVVYSQLGEFFIPQSRGQYVLRGLGMEEVFSIWQYFSRLFAYITEALIIVGFIGLVTRRINIHYEKEHYILIIAAMIFLAALIIVPGLSGTLNMTRFYHILLFILAPLCVVGGKVFVNTVLKLKKELLTVIFMLIVLIPYFLFQIGFVYEVTGSQNWSIPLSKYRINALQLYGHDGYIDDYSACGAIWLMKNVEVAPLQLYADRHSAFNILSIYGNIYRENIHDLSNTTMISSYGVVYLNTMNVVNDLFYNGNFAWNSSELHFKFVDLNRIYTNGGNEVYRNPS